MTEIQDIHQVIEVLFTQLAALRKEIELLTKENVHLREENVHLRERLSRYEHPKDSHNSHLPSSQDPIGKKHINLRQKTGRLSGGQKGHPGKTLEMQNPDKVIRLSSAYCSCCGADLSDTEGSVVEVRQTLDLPPVHPVVTEYHKIRKICSCKHVNDGSFPVGVTPGISYGSGVESLVTYLSVCQHIPYKRLTVALKELCGLSLSEGSIKNILDRMTCRTAAAYEALRKALIKSPVVGADETTVSVNGETQWAWTLQNPVITCIKAGLSRKKEEFDKIIPEGLPETVLVTDCLSGYFSANVKTHQICTSHILRELIYLSELYSKQTWSERMRLLILDALQLRKKSDGKIDASPILDRLKVLLDETLDGTHKKMLALQKRLTKYRDYLFYFLLDENVPPDNNASERTFRVFKIKLKVSGFFKSTAGVQCFAQLHSIADTARKNGQSPLTVFQTAAAIG
jgi:transposase